MAITGGFWVCLKPEGLNVPGHPIEACPERVRTCIPQAMIGVILSPLPLILDFAWPDAAPHLIPGLTFSTIYQINERNPGYFTPSSSFYSSTSLLSCSFHITSRQQISRPRKSHNSPLPSADPFTPRAIRPSSDDRESSPIPGQTHEADPSDNPPFSGSVAGVPDSFFFAKSIIVILFSFRVQKVHSFSQPNKIHVVSPERLDSEHTVKTSCDLLFSTLANQKKNCFLRCFRGLKPERLGETPEGRRKNKDITLSELTVLCEAFCLVQRHAGSAAAAKSLHIFRTTTLTFVPEHHDLQQPARHGCPGRPVHAL